MTSGLLGDVSGWAREVMDALDYWGLALLVAIENLFPPIPSEIILPLAGFNSSTGDFNVFLAILFATIGSLVGALALYCIGLYFGERRVRYIVGRWGKWLGFKESDVDKADVWFDKYGGLAVMLCRVIPIVRSLISIPAGLRKMPLLPFMLFTTIGSLTWNTILIFAGYVLGENFGFVEDYVAYLQYFVIAVVLIVVGWWVWARMIKPRREGTA